MSKANKRSKTRRQSPKRPVPRTGIAAGKVAAEQARADRREVAKARTKFERRLRDFMRPSDGLTMAVLLRCFIRGTEAESGAIATVAALAEAFNDIRADVCELLDRAIGTQAAVNRPESPIPRRASH